MRFGKRQYVSLLIFCVIVFGMSILFADPSRAITKRNSCVVESSVDGDFEGWDGDTVVVLNNGQVWRQAEYYYEYYYSYCPKVKVFDIRGGYYMLVEGIDELVLVERLD